MEASVCYRLVSRAIEVSFSAIISLQEGVQHPAWATLTVTGLMVLVLRASLAFIDRVRWGYRLHHTHLGAL